MDDLQADIGDLINEAEGLLDDLRCAESCETKADFRANVASALARLQDLSAALHEIDGEA